MRDDPRDGRIADIDRHCAKHDIMRSPPAGGSHHKVTHPAMTTILTIAAHRPIKPVYIRDLVRCVDVVRGHEA